ncbi:MAG: NAD-dependent epimerase/dehydratase family protein, partial [Bacteroidota bacterium]
ATLHNDVKRFIFVSTANCQTNGTLANPGDESGGFMPWLKGSGYAYSKFLAQQLVLDAVKEKDLPGLIVQPTFLVGPYDARPSSGALLLHGLNKRIVFHPHGGKNFIDVTSAACAIVNALTKGEIGETYLLAGENLTYANFYKKVHVANHQNSLLVPIPSVLLSLAGFFLSNLSKVFHFKTALTPTNARLLTLGNYFTGKKAESHLGMPSTDVDHAIQKALEWFEEQDYIA